MSNSTLKALIEDFFAKHYERLYQPERAIVDVLKREHEMPHGKIVIISTPMLNGDNFFFTQFRDSRTADAWEKHEFRQEYECRPWTPEEAEEHERLWRAKEKK